MECFSFGLKTVEILGGSIHSWRSVARNASLLKKSTYLTVLYLKRISYVHPGTRAATEGSAAEMPCRYLKVLCSLELITALYA